MSGSIELLHELKQARFGKSLEEIMEDEKTNKSLTLKLPINHRKESTSLELVNFGLMTLVTAIMEPIFLILAYYLFK